MVSPAPLHSLFHFSSHVVLRFNSLRFDLIDFVVVTTVPTTHHDCTTDSIVSPSPTITVDSDWGLGTQ